MHRFWETIIQAAFNILEPKTIVEVGTGAGDCTRKILQYCEEAHATLHTIDSAYDAWKSEHPNLVVHRDISLNALYGIDQFDIVLIDGDHNWYTVINELRIIEKKSKDNAQVFPLVFLHDTGWPYARRDLYYNPEVIPENFRHPYQRAGVVPGSSTLNNEDGLNNDMCHGIYENNIRSGVRTAIEDFVQEASTPLRFIHVPGLYGLGILAAEEHIRHNEDLRIFLDSITAPSLLAKHIDAVEHERFVSFYCLQQTTKQLSAAEKNLRDPAEIAEWERKLTDAIQEKEVIQSMYTNLEKRHEQLTLRNASAEAATTELEQRISELTGLNNQLESTQQSLRNELHTSQSEAAKARQRIVQSEKTTLAAKQQAQEYQALISELESKLHASKQELITQENALQQARQTIAKQEALHARMVRSASWRITHPLRQIHSMAFMYTIFGALHDLWTDFGEPCPHLVRFVRHRIFGKFWPAKIQESPQEEVEIATPTEIMANTPQDVCVIITTHNGCEMLPATLDSVLNQSLPPREILVIDDDSTDATKAVATTYAAKGVEYLKGKWHNVNAARNAGASCTSSPFMVFIESGDRLPTDYLKEGHDTLIRDTQTAIAYTDAICPGEKTDAAATAPDVFDHRTFEQENYFSNGSMVRRAALQRVGGWNHGLRRNAEWITWRRILGEGFGAAKSLSSYIRCNTPIREIYSATLCVSLSGREWMWPKTQAFLEAQTIAHNTVHLVLLDTSQQPDFSAVVEQWADSCDYGKVTVRHIAVGPKDLAQANREEHKEMVAKACCDIYNTFAEYADTPWILLLEDDVEPPANAFEQLISHANEDTVSIAALCYKRSNASLPIAWYWDNEGIPRDIAPQRGVTSVGGNGFCCTAVRGNVMRNHTFRYGPGDFCHDHNFYADIVRDGTQVALLDWECRCKHYLNANEWH